MYNFGKSQREKIGFTCLKTFYKFTLDTKLAVHVHGRRDIDAPIVTISFNLGILYKLPTGFKNSSSGILCRLHLDAVVVLEH